MRRDLVINCWWRVDEDRYRACRVLLALSVRRTDMTLGVATRGVAQRTSSGRIKVAAVHAWASPKHWPRASLASCEQHGGGLMSG